jgi:hypothetical protein
MWAAVNEANPDRIFSELVRGQVPEVRVWFVVVVVDPPF